MWFIFVYSLILMYLPPFSIHLHRKKCDIIALGILSSEEVCPTLHFMQDDKICIDTRLTSIYFISPMDLLYIRKNIFNMSLHFHFTPLFYKLTVFINKECRTLDSHVLFSKVLFQFPNIVQFRYLMIFIY